jgi:hypothetical protein
MQQKPTAEHIAFSYLPLFREVKEQTRWQYMRSKNSEEGNLLNTIRNKKHAIIALPRQPTLNITSA